VMAPNPLPQLSPYIRRGYCDGNRHVDDSVNYRLARELLEAI
jgi:hypothetical protein